MKRIDTITAGELIDMLNTFDPETPVAFTCNYGDRARTKQVITIHGNIEEESIYESAYSESGWAIKGYEDDEQESDPRLVIIR